MKKIKILTITLLIVAITMIAFIGVYTQKQNRMENQVKNYELAMDLKGNRKIKLVVDDGKTTIIKDSEGKEVENASSLTDEEIAEKGYVKEEKLKNLEEAKNYDNYKMTQKIMEKRLKKLNVQNYVIKLDEATGEIIVELPENSGTDEVISSLSTTGKFEIIDSQTKEVLMDNSNIKEAKVMYGSSGTTANAGTSVYLDIQFTKEGTKKLDEISSNYSKQEETAQTQENQTDETSQEENNQEENKPEEKTITMKIDDEEIMTTSFEEPIKTGKLQLSIGSSSNEQDTLQEYVQRASSIATVLDTGNIPLVYHLEENQYMLSDITNHEIQMIIYGIIILLVVAFITLVIKHKQKGILGIISFIGFISLFLLVIRYANVDLSIEGIFGIVVVFVLNYILLNQLVAKKEERKLIYQNFFIKIIPIIIMIVTFSFIKWMPISSFGMVMFWGVSLVAIYNSLVTNSLLKIEVGKEK